MKEALIDFFVERPKWVSYAFLCSVMASLCALGGYLLSLIGIPTWLACGFLGAVFMFRQMQIIDEWWGA